MHPNFIRMMIEMVAFAAINLGFMVALHLYLKAQRANATPLNPALFVIDPKLAIPRVPPNYFKICFLFAAVWFALFIIVKNIGISCENLDKRAQCVCYALEAKYAKKNPAKIDWATKGIQACQTSEWFPSFIKEQDQ